MACNSYTQRNCDPWFYLCMGRTPQSWCLRFLRRSRGRWTSRRRNLRSYSYITSWIEETAVADHRGGRILVSVSPQPTKWSPWYSMNRTQLDLWGDPWSRNHWGFWSRSCREHSCWECHLVSWNYSSSIGLSGSCLWIRGSSRQTCSCRTRSS